MGLRRNAIAILLAWPMLAHADEPRRHAVYAELFGKGGLWGFGYDAQLTRRVAIGAVASYYVLGGDRYTTLSPYVAAYPIGERHRWFIQLGPQFVRRSTPSPVPEWDGMSENALGGELSSGYEYRNSVLVRIYAMAAVGDRFVPWLGASLGWTL